MLQLNRVTKRYDNGQLALQDMTLSVREGEILGVVGGSGCGKSTLLRLVSGLVAPSAGAIVLDGTPVTAPRPEIGVVFQEPRLMPWLTVQQNVEFGLSAMKPRERHTCSGAILERVGLTRFAGALPRELSGGMAQRAAIARALVARPSVLLLDEPFSALDALMRSDLQAHLLDIWADTRPTMILVTHDIEEALFLADRVIVMRGFPGSVHSEWEIDLLRPRTRTAAAFQGWKQLLLGELHAALHRPATLAA
jgi:sulfonate transport system ATP-binding protein